MATSIPGDNYNLSSTFANLFKRVFKDDPMAEQDLFFFDNELLKRISVEDGFTGTDEEVLRTTSLMGGYGFGSVMPRVNESGNIRPRLEAKKYYVRALLDTESMAAAMDSKGAFHNLVERVKEDIRRGIDQGLALALFSGAANGDLQLGTIAAGGVADSDPIFVLTLNEVPGHKFHVKQILNIGTGNTDQFEVTAVDEASSAITVSLVSGTQVPAAADEIYLQGSEANAFTGLLGASAQSGTLNNVTISEANSWIMRLATKTGESPDENMLYEELINVKDKCGEYPNLIVTSKVQFLKIAEFLSDKRVLNDLSDKMGHGALSILGPNGPIEIIWDRLCPADRIYLLNTKRIKLRKRPMSGLVEHGGSVLIPNYVVDDDSYLIQYRCYGNFFIEPRFHGVIDALATS
jgi:hypothetical protein